MVFAVQCPNPKCRKYMLVEEHQQGKVVPCLLCKTSIRVGKAASADGAAGDGGNGGAGAGNSGAGTSATPKPALGKLVPPRK